VASALQKPALFFSQGLSKPVLHPLAGAWLQGFSALNIQLPDCLFHSLSVRGSA